METQLYKPGDEVIRSRKLALDTETELIQHRHIPPPVVTLQVYGGGDIVQVVKWPDIPRYLNEMNTWNPQAHYVFHNCAFDIPVLGYPSFLIEAVDAGRVHDTMLRYALFCIHERGDLKRSLSLKNACKDILDLDIDKSAEVRLSFKRESELTAEGIEYAAKDAVYTFLLDEAIPTDKTETEEIQVKGFLALDAISRRGFRVDETRRKEMEERLQTKVTDAAKVMSDNGYVPGEKGNKKVLHNLVQSYADMFDVKLPRTKKSGAISTAGDTLELFNGHPIPFLDAYKNHEYYNKIIKNWLNKDNVGIDGRVHTRFSPLVVTGRTSSSDPNIQNLPREEGVRGIFLPSEGNYLASVDYSQLELCSLAQHCLNTQGKSKLADYINSGKDVHKYLACLNYKMKEDEINWKDKEYKRRRQSAKISNFGYPGGLSATTFVDYAKGYGLTVSLEESRALRAAWLEAFPEMEKHLQPDFDAENEWYIAKTLTGRLRTHCSYTEACNSVFQGLAADGAKLMLWECFKRNIPILNFVHDEILFDVKKDDPSKMMEYIGGVQDIMIREMKLVLPDMDVKTEPCLMDRWFKMDGEFDKNGNLIVITEEYLNNKAKE
jgi:DNA polymerase I-like protein with 3'-5' exonuclease and polymerase domains